MLEEVVEGALDVVGELLLAEVIEGQEFALTIPFLPLAGLVAILLVESALGAPLELSRIDPLATDPLPDALANNLGHQARLASSGFPDHTEEFPALFLSVCQFCSLTYFQKPS